ncbi:MAG: radical SAM family heme chaperone HemW [Balneolaceae bacterium]
MSGLYLHIPFCKQACSYCDFYFVTQKEQKQRFVEELIQDIQSKKDTRFAEEKVQTIYFGGGTPSLLTSLQIESILGAISNSFHLDLKEVTLEMNPDDVTSDYLSALKTIGITRSSMGVQTFDETLLKFMNRAHSREEALNCLEILSKSGMQSFTVDLIYGSPGQELEMLDKDLELLLNYNPPHISAYSLTIEPRTRLGKQLKLGRIVEQEDEIVSTHFDLVESRLRKAGINQYEVSNFSRPGFEAKHNAAYWSHENYLGFGPGAHSFWWDENKRSAKRWNNKSDLKAYLKRGWIHQNEPEELSLQELAEERLMLGLRTIKGIELEELKKRYEFSFSDKQLSYLYQKNREGKLVLNADTLRLTKNGLKLSDSILLDIVTQT